VTCEYRVRYEDLEAYLAEVYRMEIEVLKITGAGMCPEFIVTGALPPASNARQQADNIRRGRRTKNLQLILNVLCLDGFIPTGKYIIDTRPGPPPVSVYTDLLNEHGDPDHPECVAFREKHRGKEERKRFRTLDRAALLRKLQSSDERT
jgi:hypothetical protein